MIIFSPWRQNKKKGFNEIFLPTWEKELFDSSNSKVDIICIPCQGNKWQLSVSHYLYGYYSNPLHTLYNRSKQQHENTKYWTSHDIHLLKQRFDDWIISNNYILCKSESDYEKYRMLV